MTLGDVAPKSLSPACLPSSDPHRSLCLPSLASGLKIPEEEFGQVTYGRPTPEKLLGTMPLAVPTFLGPAGRLSLCRAQCLCGHLSSTGLQNCVVTLPAGLPQRTLEKRPVDHVSR